jgi:hypothetical protein
VRASHGTVSAAPTVSFASAESPAPISTAGSAIRAAITAALVSAMRATITSAMEATTAATMEPATTTPAVAAATVLRKRRHRHSDE